MPEYIEMKTLKRGENENPGLDHAIDYDDDSVYGGDDYRTPQNIVVGVYKFWKYLSRRDLIILIVFGLMVAAFIYLTTVSTELLVGDDD